MKKIDKTTITAAIKQIAKYCVIFIIMLLLFCIGMVATYALPNGRIQAHIEESKDILFNLNGNPLFGKYIENAKLDEFTDLLIINTAMNKGKEANESILVRAFENSRFSNEDGNQYSSLEQTINNGELYNNQEYSRYWHGIQTIIRPLLLFFNYEEIRYLFMIIMFALLTIATISISKNLNTIHSLAFVFTMIAVGFFIVPASIQYTGIFAIMLITVILVNILYKLQKEKLYPYLFFIIGGVTTFFDLLTAPLLTLGIPLIYVILLKNKRESNLKKSIFEVIKLSILWCIAYGGIFLAKWVIASIILQRDVITVAINQILFRTNGSVEYPATKLGAIKENIGVLYNTVLLGLFIVISIIWAVFMVINRKKISNMKIVISLLLVAIYPYVWYITFAGHSTIHAWFTYRIQAIAILGILSAMIECIDIDKGKFKLLKTKF